MGGGRVSSECMRTGRDFSPQRAALPSYQRIDAPEVAELPAAVILAAAGPSAAAAAAAAPATSSEDEEERRRERKEAEDDPARPLKGGGQGAVEGEATHEACDAHVAARGGRGSL